MYSVRIGKNDLDYNICGRVLVETDPVQDRHAAGVRVLGHLAVLAQGHEQRVPVPVDGMEKVLIHETTFPFVRDHARTESFT
ncbi:hypothetical protein PsorP6_003137 [Peronosclerospora sorghi]|uniref:Uncharacterized protein n=1 Tax=Peronosclerospora sorghi TaxID=230839 RepID=A0ACC0VR03_9STRA|nr:hypothetical protein PsorP6_003137 [Peronosclerospora sorghi]